MLDRLVRELYKKYQIEVIRPNVDYFVDKYRTAFDQYEKQAGKAPNAARGKLPAKSGLISFKHGSMPAQAKQPDQVSRAQKKRRKRADGDEEILDLVEDLGETIAPVPVLKKASSSGCTSPAEAKVRQGPVGRQNTHFTLKRRQSTFGGHVGGSIDGLVHG